jgi:hypothetical protein
MDQWGICGVVGSNDIRHRSGLGWCRVGVAPELSTRVGEQRRSNLLAELPVAGGSDLVTDRRKERATARGFGATCSLWRGPGRLGLHALNQPPEARRQSIWRQPSPAEASSKPDEEDRDLDDKGGGLNCFGEHAGRYTGARTALHEVHRCRWQAMDPWCGAEASG